MGAKKKNEGKATSGGGKGGQKANEDTGKAKKAGQKLRIRHILCTKHAKKEEALELLNNSKTRDNFIKVAQLMSEDKAKQGGLLGDMTKDKLDPAFVEEAWKLPLYTPGQEAVWGQAKTSNGYHIIMVEAPS
ncbi:FKBP-like protein [Xylariaceae sp. FL0016]|nr:FKBP-like protein [Xylariaceae sp. FL0016]